MIVTTENSRYEIDLEAKTVTRLPQEHAGELRKDRQSVPLIHLYQPVAVGLSLTMVLDIRGDGVETLRKTSRIIKLEE